MSLDHDKLIRVADSYRESAADTRDAAQCTIPDRYREAYRRMAQHWVDLAREVEACLGWSEGTLN
ncbi:MAG: hypothetical protein ABSD74_11880 [Rhizomicrobium sp.]|jgi:hypothetical protein